MWVFATCSKDDSYRHVHAFLCYQHATAFKKPASCPQQPSPTNMKKRKAEQECDAMPLHTTCRRAPWKPENCCHLLLLTGRLCGGTFCHRTTLPPLHNMPVRAWYRLTAEQAKACTWDPHVHGDTPTMHLNGGLVPITQQGVIGKCTFSSLFGPSVQVLTVAEICVGSLVWHSPSSPDNKWNKTLLLLDGSQHVYCDCL